MFDQLPVTAFDRIPKQQAFSDAKGYVLNSHALGPVPTTNALPVPSTILIVEQFIVVILPVPDFNVNIWAFENDGLLD